MKRSPKVFPRVQAFAAMGAALLFAGFAELSAATFQSKNFVVHARSQEIARQVAECAERCRREKSLDWLGYEMQPWPTACSIDVKLTLGGAGGATSFEFENGVVRQQQMHVEGKLHRILDSVIPHEVTHTVFAHKFRRPLPRWADEGGSVLSEDREEWARHDLLVRQYCRTGRLIPLRRLFVLTEYPRDVMALYAEGFSVANYLVSLKGRRLFLDFVANGQQSSWDAAVARYYGFRDVDDLQSNWVDWLIRGVGTGADEPTGTPQAIAATQGTNSNTRTPSNLNVVRAQNSDDSEWSPASGSQGSASPGKTTSAAIASSSPRGGSSLALAGNKQPPPSPTATPATDKGGEGRSSVTRIPAAAEGDVPPKRGTLIPIAVGRARKS